MPDHLRELDLRVVLDISQRVHNVGVLQHALLAENVAFTATQTVHDAGRTANVLRHIIQEAQTTLAVIEGAVKPKA